MSPGQGGVELDGRVGLATGPLPRVTLYRQKPARVDGERIELSSLVCKTRIIPLYEPPIVPVCPGCHLFTTTAKRSASRTRKESNPRCGFWRPACGLRSSTRDCKTSPGRSWPCHSSLDSIAGDVRRRKTLAAALRRGLEPLSTPGDNWPATPSPHVAFVAQAGVEPAPPP